jgi:excisionase family DNA binding protein
MSSETKKPTKLPDTEQQQVQALERALLRGVPAFVTSAGERIEIPGTVFEVLRTAVGFMSHGHAVTLVPDNQAITTQRAADILGVSRPFFIKQLEGGLMAHHRVGNQRRIYLRDVLEFAPANQSRNCKVEAIGGTLQVVPSAAPLNSGFHY